MFKKIAIVGTGNIGSWLFQTLLIQNKLLVVSVSSRKIETLPQDLDLYVFALKDDVYEAVLQQVSFKMKHAVHTSGSLSQNILAPFAEMYGVIYPYQSITLNAESRKMKEDSLTPVCVEGCNIAFEEMLFQWAQVTFENVHKVNEQQRFAMHLAAVFANNFTNAMCGIAYQIFQENNLDWSLIFPLLENTFETVRQNNPVHIQTGPAVRNDISIMKKHCSALYDEDLKELYQLVSKIIQQKTTTE